MKSELQKYFTDELIKNEKERLLLKIIQDEDYTKEFIRQQNIWGISGLASQPDDLLSGEKAWAHFERQTQKKTIYRRLVKTLSYSAAVLLLVLSTWFMAQSYYTDSFKETYTQIQATQGQRARILLEDGTEVWLNSRSTLTYPNVFKGKERIVQLDGEGFFTVEKNLEKPFIVRTSLYDIEVTGTQFNVFNFSGSSFFETMLLEGGVRIYKKEDRSHEMKLNPHEKAIIEDGYLVRHTIGYNFHSLKNGDLICENESFDTIIKKLELYYDVTFIVENKQALEQNYTGNFRLQDPLEVILNAIQKVRKFNYIFHPEQKLVSIY